MTEITQADLDDELTAVYLRGCKDGARRERAAIEVFYKSGGTYGDGWRDVVEFMDDIRSGEHLK